MTRPEERADDCARPRDRDRAASRRQAGIKAAATLFNAAAARGIIGACGREQAEGAVNVVPTACPAVRKQADQPIWPIPCE